MSIKLKEKSRIRKYEKRTKEDIDKLLKIAKTYIEPALRKYASIIKVAFEDVNKPISYQLFNYIRQWSLNIVNEISPAILFYLVDRRYYPIKSYVDKDGTKVEYLLYKLIYHVNYGIKREGKFYSNENIGNPIASVNHYIIVERRTRKRKRGEYHPLDSEYIVEEKVVNPAYKFTYSIIA